MHKAETNNPGKAAPAPPSLHHPPPSPPAAIPPPSFDLEKLPGDRAALLVRSSATARVFVHGKDACRGDELKGNTAELAARFNEAGFAVLMIDLRGHGHSSRARLTLDPSERHDITYQTWFAFTLFAEGVRGALGRGGTYRIGGSGEVATGFSLYPEELVEAVKADEVLGRKVFLPLGHDRHQAALLRGEGWRTVEALGEGDDATALGCSHVLRDGGVQAL